MTRRFVFRYLSNYYGTCTFDKLFLGTYFTANYFPNPDWLVLMLFFLDICNSFKSSQVLLNSTWEEDKDPEIVYRFDVLVILTEKPSLGFVRKRDIPVCGKKWRKQAPSTWSWLIMCSPSFASSKAWLRRISWTWWSSSDWLSSLSPRQRMKGTLYPVNWRRHLKPFAKWSHHHQIHVHCTCTSWGVLFLTVSSGSLCLESPNGALRVDSGSYRDFLSRHPGLW